jgi:23S rRNA (adenine2503-C2)-methyltransferase
MGARQTESLNRLRLAVDFTKPVIIMQTINQTKKYLLGLSREEVRQFVREKGMAAYRADQIYKGIYVHSLSDFDRLTTLSKSDRRELNESACLRTLCLERFTTSDLDGTTKFLWSLPDGSKIESVIIYEDKRITFCISSQVGCALDCQFCTTGRMGFVRNLSSGEVVEQVMMMKDKALKPATNIVFMGMGEPLLNLRNVLKASYILSDPEGLAFSRKKITISTSGVAPAIKKLADEDIPFSLAVSLNAVFEEKRKKIMPVSDHFPLELLIKNIRYYVQKTGKRITFEYIMIRDFNDTKEDADRLIKLTRQLPCKINLIPCNSSDPAFPPSEDETVTWFADYLHDRGRTATTRLRKGWEIQAACGQLYAQLEKGIGRKITDYR